MSTQKCLYFGQYNWQGEIHKLWTHAKDSAAAHRQFVARLSKLLDISGYDLRRYFGGSRDNFKIIEGGEDK